MISVDNKTNINSSDPFSRHAFYCFETLTEHYETLFEDYGDSIPQEEQAAFIEDISARLSEDMLYPYHYEGEKFTAAVQRIKNLLNRIDCDTIINRSAIDVYRACYWLSMKENADITVSHDGGGMHILADGKEFYSQTDFTVVIHKPRIEADCFRVTAYIDSLVFDFLKESEYEIFAVENGKRIKLDTFVSVHSNNDARTVTNIFPAFHYSCDLRENSRIEFEVKIGETVYKTHFSFMPYSGLKDYFRKINRGRYIIGNGNTFLSVRPASQLKIDILEILNTLQFIRYPRNALLRLKSIFYRKKHRIWLYYDFYTVEKDNGFFQFENDLKHDDGIERYYVLTHKYDDIDSVFTPGQKKHTVKMGSPEHRLLFLCAERIFTGYYGMSPINAFDSGKQKYMYEDLIKFRTVYLQHGVLHAALRLNNSEERSQAEEIVVSSPFEVRNYTENYAYSRDELITTGMARYDRIDKNRVPQNRILFAPSWRKYLTNEIKASTWDADVERIKSSDYYKNFLAFLSDKKLHSCLEKTGIYLDIKLHPIIANLEGLFDIDCKYINMVNGNVEVGDYKAFVTDFSSYVFDFAYLNRPIMYFVPDYPQFRAGLNHYRDLDLPFSEAFGEMFTEADKAAECLCGIVESGFVPEKVFAERMENFYFEFDGNCAENLYKYVVGQDKKLKIQQ